MRLHSVKLEEFTFFYRAESEFLASYQDIFQKNIYQVVSSNSDQLIIDGGAHIGIATLFFRKCMPNARIISFEPNPHTFEILKKNIKFNGIKNVELHNCALSNSRGKLPLYGLISGSCDTRGNSIVRAWGERDHTEKLVINTERLSGYIKEPVGLLKLDVEGAEQQIIQDIHPKLPFIKHIAVECHETKHSMDINSIKNIKRLLEEFAFDIVLYPKNPLTSLPDYWRDWIADNTPSMARMMAHNKNLLKDNNKALVTEIYDPVNNSV